MSAGRTRGVRRLAWTSYGAAIGLAAGTVAALAGGAEVAAAVGAVQWARSPAWCSGRLRERRR